MRLTAMIVTAGMIGLAPLAAAAQPAPPASTVACTVDANLPAELAGWTAKTPVSAATKATGLAKATVAPGKAAEAMLPPTPDVTYIIPPEKPADPATHGGLFGLSIDKPGTYVVAVGSDAWVDLLKDGKAVASSAHSHGPACSTIRKLVDFPLQPGRYVLQLSSGPDAKTGVLVARRP